VSVRTIEDFVCHDVCAFYAVAVAAGGAKPRFAAEIDVMKLVAMFANKSGIAS